MDNLSICVHLFAQNIAGGVYLSFSICTNANVQTKQFNLVAAASAIYVRTHAHTSIHFAHKCGALANFNAFPLFAYQKQLGYIAFSIMPSCMHDGPECALQSIGALLKIYLSVLINSNYSYNINNDVKISACLARG